MYIVLAALALLGGGGYWYLKPVRDAAHLANQAVATVKDKAGNVVSLFSSKTESIMLYYKTLIVNREISVVLTYPR